MKKFLTFIAASALAMSAFAADYAGKITVLINGEGTSQDATIQVDQNEDGTYTLNVKNFRLISESTTIDVGNIVLDNMKGYKIHGVTTIVADQNVEIAPGDDESVAMWLGPYLGEVPLVLAAQFDETNLKVEIDIDMQSVLDQFIYVKFNTREEGTGIKGDVNADGSVTAADVTAVYEIMLNE